MLTLTLEQKIGQMLLIGYPGGAEGEVILRRVLEGRPMGNLILFARNAGEPSALQEQLFSLRALIEERTCVPPLVAMDQEGGIVVRLNEGLTPLPGAMSIAAALGGGGITLADVEALASVAGSELRSLGVDWNLAPVADVNVNPDNPVIGVRSFGEDPSRVADLVSAYARGLHRSGVVATAKHFPGHGDTNVDSHLGLPTVNATLERLDSVELLPFRRLIAEDVGSIMTAHVLFPAVEPDPVPATLSHRVLTGLLRERLGYRGVIVTDCLEMKAVDGRYEDLAVRAVLAGADVLCVSHTAFKQEAAFDSLLAAVLGGVIPESRIDESVARILALKQATAASTKTAPALALAAASSVELAARISSASISPLAATAFPDLSRGGLYIDLKPATLTGAEDRRIESVTVSGVLAETGSALDCVVLPCDPDDKAIEALVARIGTVPVIISVYAMSRYPEQERLVQRMTAACAGKGVPLAFISMREPYDARIIVRSGGGNHAVLCAYEYTNLSARAIARVLAGTATVRGSCPVRITAPV